MVLQINKAKRRFLVETLWGDSHDHPVYCFGGVGPVPGGDRKQLTFASPEEAVKAMVEALKSNDLKALEAIFGPGSRGSPTSGDPVADQSGRERFLRLYEREKQVGASRRRGGSLYWK